MRPSTEPRRPDADHERGPQGPPNRSLGLRRTTAALATSEGFAWAPLVAALAVDLADFATAGPLGLVAGLFVGGLLTAVVSLSAGARPGRAMLLALLGGLYCALPLTEAVPLATILTLLHTALPRTKALQPEPARVVQAGPPRREG